MLQHLFSPLAVGRLKAANRIMMPGMSAGMMLDHEGRPTPEMIAYYVERARTRPGMIAIGSGAVVPPVGHRRHPLSLHDDSHIDSLRTIVDAVHAHDTLFGVQLWDGGIQTGGKVLLSPSGIGMKAGAVVESAADAPVVKVLTLDEIEAVIGHFAAGAERCEKAGFDFVEIHAGHGYLISAFLAPHFNHRTDRYGGTFENRVRFLVEILRQVRKRVGDRLAVGVKFNGDDFLPPDGWKLEEACRLAPILEREGADYLSITAGVMGAQRLTVPPLYEKQGCFSDMAAEIRRLVSIPVATVGRVKEPEMADALVRDGAADIVCMGRAMIADSQIVEKARAGALHEIRRCLADCRGCIDQEMRGIKRGDLSSTSCVVNPRMQRESVCIDIEGDKSHDPRSVLVVGAGLAGLEAARRCAFSGHRVVLCESRPWIGGQIRLAAMIPGRREIADMLPWYEGQLAKYGVDVRLGTTVDSALLESLAPDVVIVATGSVPTVPQDMLETLYSAENMAIFLADELLEEGGEVGENVLVVGGDQIGIQMADYLSEIDHVRNVYVIEGENHFAQKLAANDRWYIISRLIRKKVKRFKNVSGIAIEDGGKVLVNARDGVQEIERIDTIVFASERRSERSVLELAKTRGFQSHVLGDASDIASEDSGTILSNIAQAYDLARSI